MEAEIDNGGCMYYVTLHAVFSKWKNILKM